MTISEKNDKYLYKEYQLYNTYLKLLELGKKAAFSAAFRETLKQKAFSQFCQTGIAKSIESVEDKEKMFFHLTLTAIRKQYSDFNVDYVSQPFTNAVDLIKDTMLASVSLDCLYDTLGSCSGYILFNKWCIAYSITENLSLITCKHRNELAENAKGLLLYRGESYPIKDMLDLCDSEIDNALYLGLAILIARKLIAVETKIISSGVKRVMKDTGDSVSNRTPFHVNYVDSSWFKTIVRTEGFFVKGFFRLQRVGVGRMQTKLIYIKPQYRRGYTRRAKKLIAQEIEIKKALSVA